MGKKRNASAAGTSISKDIHDLQTIHSDLVKEVAELRKQIEHLCSRLNSLIANPDIPDSADPGVLGHVLSSTIAEAEARNNAQIAEATYNAEMATAEPNAMELPSLIGQDAVEKELDLIIDGGDVAQYSQKDGPDKRRKKIWIFYPIVVTAIFCVSMAVVSLFNSSNFKK